MLQKKEHPKIKSQLHPRNKHRERNNFKQLRKSCPELAPFIIKNKYNDESINFFDPKAVILLNRALLKHFYEIEFWNIPDGYLCPPIPGRADYIHYIADLLSTDGIIPTGNSVKCLDIGVGANCKMIEESLQFADSVLWFSTLVSKEANLPGIYLALKKVNAREVKTINMGQGNKKSRIVAWAFQ